MPEAWELEAPPPFDLARTVLSHGFYEVPPFRWHPEDGLLEIAVRHGAAGRPLLVSVIQRRRSARRPRLEIEVRGGRSGSGATTRRLVGSMLSHCLDFGRDLGGFYRICRSYAPLAWVPPARAGRILRCPDVFADVVVSICGTNTGWKQAVRSVRRICDLAPAAPGTDLACFPTPAEILAAGAPFLVDAARVGYRHRTILELCRLVEEGAVDLDAPSDPAMDGPAMRAFFASLPGIGPVTARYLACLHGRTDELSVDSFVLKYIGDKYHGGARPTVAQVEARYARFGDLRAHAYWFELLGDVDPFTWKAREGTSPPG